MSMKPNLLLACAAFVALSSGCQNPAGVSGQSSGRLEPLRNDYPAMGVIERLDPAFDNLVPAGAVIEKLAEGFTWTEGPVWMPEGVLLFCDIPANSVMRWEEGRGASVFLRPSGYTGTESRGGESGSNGLARDAQGRLILCQHGDRRVARLERDGKFATLADRYEGRRFNSPNDLVFRSNGDLYFTDPPYGLEKGMKDPKKELPFQGVYRLAPDGKVTLLFTNLSRPNGIALSPDEKTLYVGNSDGANPVIMAYPLQRDGTPGAGRVFFDMRTLPRKGGPDGMKVDRQGNLFTTGPGGVLIITPEGRHLGTLVTGQPTANCAWGHDGSVLYITANHTLCRVRTLTKGLGWR